MNQNENLNVSSWTRLPENFHNLTLDQQIAWLKSFASTNAEELNEHKLGIGVSKEQASVLGEHFAKLISTYAPHTSVAIDISENGHFERNEMKNVAALRNALLEVHCPMVFEDLGKLYSFEKTCEINSAISSWVEVIKNTKHYGKPLSPLEKYLKAYHLLSIVGYGTSVDKYFSDQKIFSAVHRKAGCAVGDAEFLATLLKGLGIESSYTNIVSHNSNGDTWNKNFSVKIKDEKYHIEGVFTSDPTFAAKQGEEYVANMLKNLNSKNKSETRTNAEDLSNDDGGYGPSSK